MTISTIPLVTNIFLGFVGACIPKIIELYYNGKLCSIENRLKKNPNINKNVNIALEIIWVMFGTIIAVYFGTTEVNTITTGMGWEAILMAYNRGEKNE